MKSTIAAVIVRCFRKGPRPSIDGVWHCELSYKLSSGHYVTTEAPLDLLFPGIEIPRELPLANSLVFITAPDSYLPEFSTLLNLTAVERNKYFPHAQAVYHKEPDAQPPRS